MNFKNINPIKDSLNHKTYKQIKAQFMNSGN